MTGECRCQNTEKEASTRMAWDHSASHTAPVTWYTAGRAVVQAYLLLTTQLIDNTAFVSVFSEESQTIIRMS